MRLSFWDIVSRSLTFSAAQHSCNLLVDVQDPLVVAGTNKYKEFIVVPNKGADSADSLNERKGVTANPETGDWNPERIKARPRTCFSC
jgi:hypothetical protein